MNSNLNPISKNIMDALTAYHERNASINPDPYALLQNKAVLGSYLNDFVKNYSEDPILKMAVSNDIGSIIHEGIGKSAVEQMTVFQRAVKSMTDMGISADKATEIVKYFSDALDWQIQTQPTAPQASAPVMGGGNVTLGASGQNAIPTGNSNFGGEVNRNNYAAPSGGNVTLNSGNRTPIPNNGNVQFSQPNTSALRSGGATYAANNNNARFTQQNSPMPTSGSTNSVIVNDPPKKKKSKGGILFLLLLIILGGGGYMWYTNNMKPITEVSEASVNVSEPNIATEQTITDEQAETPSVAKETNGKTTELAADKTTQTTKVQKAETKTPAAIPVKTLLRVSADTDSAYYGDTWDNWNTRMQYDADNQLLYYTDSSKKVKIYDLKKDVDNNYLDLESEMNYITFNEFTHTLFLYVYNHYYEYVDGNFNALL